MAIEEALPYPIIDIEFQLTIVVIIVAFGMLLCLKKTFPDFGQECVALLELAIQRDHPSHTRLI